VREVSHRFLGRVGKAEAAGVSKPALSNAFAFVLIQKHSESIPNATGTVFRPSIFADQKADKTSWLEQTVSQAASCRFIFS
jgi:hypothetical protein